MGLLVEDLDADEVRANLSPNLATLRRHATKHQATRVVRVEAEQVRGQCDDAAVAPRQAYRDRARSWCEKSLRCSWTPRSRSVSSAIRGTLCPRGARRDQRHRRHAPAL